LIEFSSKIKAKRLIDIKLNKSSLEKKQIRMENIKGRFNTALYIFNCPK
jgi:hypothetical protein